MMMFTWTFAMKCGLYMWYQGTYIKKDVRKAVNKDARTMAYCVQGTKQVDRDTVASPVWNTTSDLLGAYGDILSTPMRSSP